MVITSFRKRGGCKDNGTRTLSFNAMKEYNEDDLVDKIKKSTVFFYAGQLMATAPRLVHRYVDKN